MAEVLASLKKIGGNGEQYTETSLWTNPSPTADFAAQTITLSDSISKYKYIGIKYCYAKTSTDIISTPIYKTEDLRASVLDNGTTHNVIILGVENANNYGFGRFVGYVSDTSIKFTIAYRLNVASTLTNAVIPLEILGINELAHGKIYEHYATGYFTNTVRSVDLGFVPKYVFCANGGSASGSNNSNIIIYDANVSTTQFKFIANGTEEMQNIGTIGSAVQFSMEGTVIGMNPNTTITNFMNSHRQYVAIGYDNQ